MPTAEAHPRRLQPRPRPPLRSQPPRFAKAALLGAGAPSLDGKPAGGASFASLPAALTRKKNHVRWKKMLATELYRGHPLALWRCTEHKLVSRADESEPPACEPLEIAPRKSEISIERFSLVWTPWSLDPDGIAEPVY